MGAHNTPCLNCGKINWEQDLEEVKRGYPIFNCKTSNCTGRLFSD